jgi:hypothetical protein
MRDRFAGGRHADPIELGNGVEQKQQEKHPLTTASDFHRCAPLSFGRK